MALLPFRGLAEKGILHDPNPYQLDLNAFSNGAGIRFHSNKAMRSPIWRSVYGDGAGLELPEQPAFCVGHRPSTGYDLVFIAGEDGRLFSYSAGSLVEITPTGFVPVSDPRAFTAAFNGDVTYINRPSSVPYYFAPGTAAFQKLPGWSDSWSCRSMRAFGDYLIALNVTKGTAVTPSMVKWSDLVLAGQPPGSWDATDSTTNAGENILEDLDTPLVDGLAMRGVFVLYSQNQIWAMTPVAGQLVFNFDRLFSEGGMIAPNCAVEVDGKHYVFGPTDIYVHDGNVKQSLIDKRNRDYVFRNLDVKSSEVCFVAHMPKYNEIVFAYRTGDSSAAFQGTARCNKAAVYNIPGDTWSFIDLPDIGMITQANIDGILTYADASAVTYGTVGGTYYDQENSYAAHVVAASRALPGTLSNARLVAYDFMNKGSLSFPYSAECNAPAFVERIGLDLEQIGSDMSAYKTIRRLFPQVTMFDNIPIEIQVGASMTPSGPVAWGAPQTFDPTSQYKLDMRTGGRYLAVRFTVAEPADFEIAGFDFDVYNAGNW